MQYSVTQKGIASVVALSGNIDVLTAAECSQAFKAEIEQGRFFLVADLGQVGFMSSAGLRLLMQTAKEARQKGGDLRLARPTPLVEKMLEISGFTSILMVFPGVDQAVASYSG